MSHIRNTWCLFSISKGFACVRWSEYASLALLSTCWVSPGAIEPSPDDAQMHFVCVDWERGA